MSIKTAQNGKCIYTQPSGLCDGSEPLHKKEHYLPAGLGNFRNDVRLRDYICKRCQHKFSTLEDVFMHHGPEAFFRHIVGVRGRKQHRKKNIFYEPTAGMPPLRVTAKHPSGDFTVLWEIDGMTAGCEMKQLVFRDEQNCDLHLPFIPGQLDKDFERFRKEQSDKKLRLIACFFDSADEEEFKSVCSDFLKGTLSEVILPERCEVEGEMRAWLSLPYYRAVAKIAFHFILAHFPFTGLEPQFDGIKRFIFTGRDHDRFVQNTDEQFVEEFKDHSVLSKDWCHFLSAQYDYNAVEARMQFFSGPKARPIVWRVMLGSSPARVVGTFNRGFVYRYFDAPNEKVTLAR
jgi:hypothetical protein